MKCHVCIIFLMFIVRDLHFVTGDTDIFEQKIKIGKRTVLCHFKFVYTDSKVLIGKGKGKSKIICKKFTRNIKVKNKKITSSSGNIFTVTLTIKKNGGNAVLKHASVQIAPAPGTLTTTNITSPPSTSTTTTTTTTTPYTGI